MPANNNPAVQATDSKHLSSKRGVKRKYEESYLGFGFGRTDSEDCLDVLCVICQDILRNSSLALAKMKKHFEKNHPTLVGRNISYFEARLREIKGMQEIYAFNSHFNRKIIGSILPGYVHKIRGMLPFLQQIDFFCLLIDE